MDSYESASASAAETWAWKLDTRSGSSASLGPSTSTSLTSTDPLSWLSQPSAASSADDVFWQDFRPTARRCSRRERKRARLHRFDSDDEEEEKKRAARPCEEDVKAQAVSEDEDANGLGHTSSEGSDSERDEEYQEPPSRKTPPVKTEVETDDLNSAAPPLPAIASSTSAQQSKQTRAKLAAASTQIIALAIHKHALCNSIEDAHPDSSDPPMPLTYKETVRLVRLIAMIFRFPKASRRIVRHRRHRQSIGDSTPPIPSSSSSDLPSTPTVLDGGLTIELKRKYLPLGTDTSSSHKPRILAKVHPDDTQPNSAAVLKLIALIPAALPARVRCVEWIVRLAVKARRDEHGNILLPDTAYITAVHAKDAGKLREDAELKREDEQKEIAESEEKKVTRSMRQRLGKDAPSIPLPEFWRRRGAANQEQSATEGKVEVAQVQLNGQWEGLTSSNEEAEVDVLTCSVPSGPTSIPLALISDVTGHSSPNDQEPSHFEHQREPEESVPIGGAKKRVKVVNLSKLLAERMREKRQAKTLLLRTHESLRKRRSTEADAGTNAEAEEEEDVQVDAETAANTVANSGAVSNTLANDISDLVPNEVASANTHSSKQEQGGEA